MPRLSPNGSFSCNSFTLVFLTNIIMATCVCVRVCVCARISACACVCVCVHVCCIHMHTHSMCAGVSDVILCIFVYFFARCVIFSSRCVRVYQMLLKKIHTSICVRACASYSMCACALPPFLPPSPSPSPCLSAPPPLPLAPL